MTQYKILGWLLIIASALAGAYTTGYIAAEHKQLTIEQVATKAADNAAVIAAKAIAELQIKNTTINTKVREIIKTETVYADCKHTPEAYELLLEKFLP